MAAETRREKAKAERRRVDAREMAKQDAKKGSFTMNHVKVPDGMPTIRFKEDKLYQFDIVPFVAGKENPNADEGVETYERRVYAHSGIGLDQRAFYVCPLETSKRGRAKKLRPCPVCEHAAKMALRGDDWDARKPFMPKERQIMQVIDLEDRKKGVQLFEGSFNKGLGELLKNKLSKLPEDSKKKWFWTYDEGMHLHVGVEQDTFKGQSYFKPVNVEFEQRDKQYGPEFLEKGVCLDDLVAEAELSYDELAEIFHQSPSADDGNGDAEPARNGSGHSRTRPAEADDEGQDDAPAFKRGDKVKHREFGVCDVVHVSGDGTSLKLEDEEGELHNAVDPADCKPATKSKPAADDDDDALPVRSQAKKSRTGQDDADEDDGDEDDADEDDDDGPPPAKAQGKKGKPAPVDDDEEEELDDDEGEEEEPEEEEEENDPPPAKAGKGKKPAVAEEDDGDDEWEDDGDEDEGGDDDWDDDDEPVKSKAKGKPAPAKPAGKKGK